MSTYHVLSAIWIGVLPMLAASVFIVVACYILCCLNRIKDQYVHYRKRQRAKQTKKKFLAEQKRLQKTQHLQQLEKQKQLILKRKSELNDEHHDFETRVVVQQTTEGTGSMQFGTSNTNNNLMNEASIYTTTNNSSPTKTVDYGGSTTTTTRNDSSYDYLATKVTSIHDRKQQQQVLLLHAANKPPSYVQLKSALTLNLDTKLTTTVAATNNKPAEIGFKPILECANSNRSLDSELNSRPFSANRRDSPLIVQELNESPKSLFYKLQLFGRSSSGSLLKKATKPLTTQEPTAIVINSCSSNHSMNSDNSINSRKRQPKKKKNRVDDDSSLSGASLNDDDDDDGQDDGSFYERKPPTTDTASECNSKCSTVKSQQQQHQQQQRRMKNLANNRVSSDLDVENGMRMFEKATNDDDSLSSATDLCGGDNSKKKSNKKKKKKNSDENHTTTTTTTTVTTNNKTTMAMAMAAYDDERDIYENYKSIYESIPYLDDSKHENPEETKTQIVKRALIDSTSLSDIEPDENIVKNILIKQNNNPPTNNNNNS